MFVFGQLDPLDGGTLGSLMSRIFFPKNNGFADIWAKNTRLASP